MLRKSPEYDYPLVTVENYRFLLYNHHKNLHDNDCAKDQ